MKALDKLGEAVRHPATAAAGVASLIGIAIKPAVAQAIGLALWQSAPSLFTAFSIAGFTLPKWIPGLDPLKPLLVAGAIGSGLLYLAKLATKTYDNFQERL